MGARARAFGGTTAANDACGRVIAKQAGEYKLPPPGPKDDPSRGPNNAERPGVPEGSSWTHTSVPLALSRPNRQPSLLSAAD